MMGKIFLFHLYSVWAVVSGICVWHFSASALISWRSFGGRWRNVLGEWLCVPRYIFSRCMSDIAAIAKRRRLDAESHADIPYDGGHMLRFMTAISFMATVIIALIFRSTDTSDWHPWYIAMNVAVVTTSIVSGFGYLYVRWWDFPRRWRWLVVSALMWLIIAPLIG